MNKRWITILTVAVFSLVFVSANGFAQTHWKTTDARTMIGYRVYSPISNNTPLGQISDFMIDQSNGRIALIILSDVPGFGAERVAVPYGSVVRNAENEFVLRIPEQEIGFGTFGDVYLNRYRRALAPGVLPAAIDATWVDNLYRHYEQFPYWTAKGEHSPMAFYRADSVIGANVDLAQGDVAKVEDLVFQSSSGRILFATVSNVSGWTDSSFAVPYRMLSRKGENAFAMNVTRDKLTSEPSFNTFEDLGSRGYALSVYRHFGVRPYWAD